MFLNKGNEDSERLLDDAHNSPGPSNNIISLRTYRIVKQNEDDDQVPLVSTEFNDLQDECNEREDKLRESRAMSLKTKEYRKKIEMVFNVIETLKSATKPDLNETVEANRDGKYQPKWTELHQASARGLGIRIRELLKDGANPNVIDDRGRTALDVAGISFYQGIDIYSLADVLRTLMNAGGTFNTMKGNIDVLDTPIHTAIELNCVESIKLLMDANATVNCLNSSGLTPLHIGIKKRQEKPFKMLLTYKCNAEDITKRANTRDHSGFTLLQAAVVTEWTQGVSILLDAGADVTATSDLPFDFYNNVIIDDSINFIYRLEQIHETPVHLAAEVGNQQIIRKLLNKCDSVSNLSNHLGQSPLYIAIREGHISCIKVLLNMNANIWNVSNDGQNALHTAVRFGREDVVEFLLDYQNKGHELLSSFDRQGYAPIHSAAAFNRSGCIMLFAKNNAFLRLKTRGYFIANWTALHIAAAKNYPDVAEVILDFDKTAKDDADQKGRLPIHLAANRRNREVMAMILRKGSILSSRTNIANTRWRYKEKEDVTALEMISTELPNPTSFLQEVFDSFIESKDPELDNESGSLISMDYGIFTKVNDTSQIKVLKELVTCGQDKLLIHPLVESLIYLKWKTLLPFFYVTVAIYGFFALIFYAVIIGDFYDENRDVKQNYSSYLISPLVVVILLESLYINVHRWIYLSNVENWVKLGTIILACALLFAGHASWTEAQWTRHVATSALLLACAQILILASRFPYVGFYVLMFGKVSINIFKILLTFIFLLFAFSLCFMIQYHSKPPFNGPWAASIKTIVMMTSEFEYENLFDDEKHKDELAGSREIVNIFFLLFLLFVSIVFVNFMVGVAVSDVNELKTEGNIRRLEKQVEFLSTLEVLAFGAVFKRLLSKEFRAKRFVKGIKIKADVTKTWIVLYEVIWNNESQTFEREITLP